MSQNLDNPGLRSIFNQYNLFYIDIWGVIHNGVKIYNDSLEVLQNLKNENKEFVLLTNAPRPNLTVINFLKKIGLKDFHENVYTSGEASLKFLLNNFIDQKFFHIGQVKDFDLFRKFNQNKVNRIEESDYIICTGLFENKMTNLDYYKDTLKEQLEKKFICTNPDLIVDKGNVREYCAGSVAKAFEEIGGKVIYFGKPYSPVYNLSANISNKNVLCIGDNMNTDIKGANNQNFDSLLITSGIHNKEFTNYGINKLEKIYGTSVNYIQTKLKW
tara:strand:+ start:51 stop:866 length:816 start_codon:yes stop_codon:yes gene_type:complete